MTIDLKVLRLLASNARITWSELASHLGLTPPAAAERVRKLEEKGLVRGYAAIFDSKLLGLDVTAFVSVSLTRPQDRKAFLKRVGQTQEILECHHVAGSHDYLLKVRCRTTADLERVLAERIKAHGGLVRTETTVVLSTQKETSIPPLDLTNKEVK